MQLWGYSASVMLIDVLFEHLVAILGSCCKMLFTFPKLAYSVVIMN